MPDSNTYGNLMDIAEELIRSGKNFRIGVTGNSMFPSIRKGDIVSVQSIKLSEIKCGNIIVYRMYGQFIAHRFVRKKNIQGKEFYIVRGDTCDRFDPPLEGFQIIGRIDEISREKKIISMQNFLFSVKSRILAKSNICRKFHRKLFRLIQSK